MTHGGQFTRETRLRSPRALYYPRLVVVRQPLCQRERERERRLGEGTLFFSPLYSLYRQLDGRCRRSDFHNAPCTLPHSTSLTPSHPPPVRLRRPSNATRTPRRRPSPRPFHRTTSERERATDDHRETFAERRGPRSSESFLRERRGG